jgi:Tfp pilus assembly protein PilV
LNPRLSASAPAKRSAGFTLLEVLIAFVIAMLLVTGALFVTSGINNERFSYQQRLAANTLAWNRLMEQYQLIEGWIPRDGQLGESNARGSAFGQDWRWELTAVSTLGEDFYRYEVLVFADDTEQDSAKLAAYFIAK